MHRGEFLKLIVTQNNISITKLVNKVGYDRSSYYNHIKQPNLDFKILKSYGDQMGYNFAKDFPEMLIEFPESDQSIDTFEGMKADRDFWRDEFTRLHKLNQIVKEERDQLQENYALLLEEHKKVKRKNR